MAISKATNSGLAGSKYNIASADNYYMEPIASTLVGVGGASTVAFNNIPQVYKHLEIRMLTQSNRATYGTDNISLRINGDSDANYAYHYLRGSGAAAASGAAISGTEITEFTTQGCGTSTGGTFGGGVASILDYTNTNKFKTVRNLSGVDLNSAVGGGYGYVSLVSGLWMNTAPITSLLFYPVNGSLFTQNSRFSLYGIKG